MLKAGITEKIENKFTYLFDDYEYRFIAGSSFESFGNWMAVLWSPSYGRLLFFQDRGEIVVALGPHSTPPGGMSGTWYDMAVVAEYLSEGEDMLTGLLGEPDRQLDWFAGVLRPYMARIGELFGGPAFEAAREDLDRIGARREAELDDG